MIVKDILDTIDDSKLDYELRMSCFTKDHTLENPLYSDCGTLYSDCGMLCFEIDWKYKNKTYINELFVYDKNTEIVSWDVDDGNRIDFECVVVSDEHRLIILV